MDLGRPKAEKSVWSLETQLKMDVLYIKGQRLLRKAQQMDPVNEAYNNDAKRDTTYCVIIHDSEHVEHVILFKDKPNILNIKHILDEMETDEEFRDSLSAPIDELNLDLMTYGQAMRCMPEHWKEMIKDSKEELYG